MRLKDVAQLAGVAVNTASTILNQRPNSWASKNTRERVMKAAEELGYRPNRAALALQSGRFNTIGLLVADLDNPYFCHFSKVFGSLVEREGFDLVIESWQTSLEREARLLDDFVDRNIDGLAVFVSNLDEHKEILTRHRKAGFPIVALAMPGAGDAPVDVVMPNFELGLEDATRCLYQLGHRRFAFLAALSEGQKEGGRIDFFRAMIQQFDDTEIEFVQCGPGIDDARIAGLDLLRGDVRPTAVVCLNDLCAFGVMRAAKELSLEVPEDLSVVGVDGVPLGEHLIVSLTTIQQAHVEMAEQAFEFLKSRLEGDRETAPRVATFDARFIARESIAKAR